MKLEVAEYHNELLVDEKLPPEIWELIIQKLDIAEFHVFSAVCRSWRSIAVAAKQNHHFSLQQLPWLMLSNNDNNSFQDEDDSHHGFFSLSQGNIFKLKLPEVHGARCCGSSWGWLIMANDSGDNFLLNPFSRLQIQLPSLTTLPMFSKFQLWYVAGGLSYIRKAMLLSPPSAAAAIPRTASTTIDNSVADNNSCVVVAIYQYMSLCFCRPGDQAWTPFGNKELRVSFEDIIFYNGRLYAVTKIFDLVLVELGPNPRGTQLNMPCPEGYDHFFRKYCTFVHLVESFGQLLMVVRECKFPPDAADSLPFGPLPPRITTAFKVFKFDKAGPRWINIDNIGDQMLFLGTSSGISLSASHFSGFKGNRIYFTDENFTSLGIRCGRPHDCRDLGVFNLEDGSIKSFFPTDSHSSLSPPIWFVPSAF